MARTSFSKIVGGATLGIALTTLAPILLPVAIRELNKFLREDQKPTPEGQTSSKLNTEALGRGFCETPSL